MKKLLLLLLCVPLIGFSSFPVNNVDTLDVKKDTFNLLSDTIKYQNDTILYDSLQLNHINIQHKSDTLLNQEIKRKWRIDRFIIFHLRVLGTVILAAAFVFLVYISFDSSDIFLEGYWYLFLAMLGGIAWIWGKRED